MAPKQRHRPVTYQINPMKLADAFAALATLRDPGFDWGAADYGANRRGLVADEAGLARFKPGLLLILAEAPSGFPSWKRLKAMFLEVHRRHGVFGAACADPDLSSHRAADRWRIMCADVYKCARRKHCDDSIKDLVSKIVLGTDGGSPPSTAAAASAPSEPPPAAPAIPSNDVEMCSASPVPSLGDDDSAFSSDDDGGADVSDGPSVVDCDLLSAVCRSIQTTVYWLIGLCPLACYCFIINIYIYIYC